MTDIKRMSGEFEGPETENGMAVLKGSVPAAEMNGYQKRIYGVHRRLRKIVLFFERIRRMS